jgi:hypothetical protein
VDKNLILIYQESLSGDSKLALSIERQKERERERESVCERGREIER